MNPLSTTIKDFEQRLINPPKRKYPDELRQVLQPVLAENLTARQTYALAQMSLGGLTSDQFEAAYPGVDPRELLARPDVAQQVELLASMASLQERCLNMSLRRCMADSVTVLSSKLQSEDCTPGMARDIGDTLTKVANLLDRRSEAKRDGGGEREPNRYMVHAFGSIHITTPEGKTEITSSKRDQEGVITDVVRAMRCTTDVEVQAVIDSLERPSGSLTLRGF